MEGRSGKVENKYAKTLFELSAPEEQERRKGALEEWLMLLGQIPELQRALENPAVPMEERIAVVHEVAERCSPGDQIFKNFLAEVVKNGRIDSFAGISQAFARLVDEARGVLSMQVISAFELPENERQELRLDMERILEKKLAIEWITDRNIIGGLIVRTGDSVLDNSIKGALERVRRELLV